MEQGVNQHGNIFSHIREMVRRTVAVFFSGETPWYVKLLLIGGLLYALSPYDLIPDWVPVFGLMDDLALAILLISWASGYGRER
jgi:uncharacterized membrane protein YkvA (DUF1232 family)